MFLRYYDVLPLPAHEVESVVLVGPANWLPGIAVGSLAEGDRLIVAVGLGESYPVRKAVEVTVGESVRRGSTTVLPISWQAHGSSALFPTMIGEVEIVPLGADHTQVALNATYTTPLNGIGKLADRALL